MTNHSMKVPSMALSTLVAAALMAAVAVSAGASIPSDYWITTKTKIALFTAKDVSGWAISVDNG